MLAGLLSLTLTPILTETVCRMPKNEDKALTLTVRINSHIQIRYDIFRRFHPTRDASNGIMRTNIYAEVGKKGAHPQIDCKHNKNNRMSVSHSHSQFTIHNSHSHTLFIC